MSRGDVVTKLRNDSRVFSIKRRTLVNEDVTHSRSRRERLRRELQPNEEVVNTGVSGASETHTKVLC